MEMYFDIAEFNYERVIAAYDLFQVELCANCNTTVKKAYYKLCQTHHPDRHEGSIDAAEKFKELNSAFQYLKDQEMNINAYKTEILKAAKSIPIQSLRSEREDHLRGAIKEQLDHEKKEQLRREREKQLKHEKEEQQRRDEQLKREEEEQQRCAKEKQQRSEAQEQQRRHDREEQQRNREREEQLRREREKIYTAKQEVETLCDAFEQISPPNHMNVFESQQYLIRECSTLLLNEGVEFSDHIFNMINHLSEKKQEISLELMKVRNNISYIFPNRDLNIIQKEEILNYYMSEVNSDLQVLKCLNVNFEKAFINLRKDKSFSSIMALNASIEQLNTEIANIQLKNYYLRGKSPRELNLNYITRITEEFIKDHENIHVTSLCQEALYKIDKNIINWKNLETIKITKSPYIGFPVWLHKMQNLIEINLEGNHITTLPETLGELSQLEVLNLNNNYLNNVPQSFVNLKNLTCLILSNNQFEHIPESLKALVNLIKLVLSGNKISCLPESIVDNWGKLEVLYIDNNLLTTLPRNIGDMPSLKFINAINNQITFIPSSILQLKGKLRCCYLDQNLLHQHALPVAAILYLMGGAPDKLLETQNITDSCPMELEDAFSFDEDVDLFNLSSEFFGFLNSNEEVRATKMPFAMGCYTLKTTFNLK